MSMVRSCPPHYWVFEEPKGAAVHGVCRQCGAHTQRPSVVEPMQPRPLPSPVAEAGSAEYVATEAEAVH